jgi:hypothetical protein
VNPININYINLVNEVLQSNEPFIITMEEGTYESVALAYEIQNLMNIAVNNRILAYANAASLRDAYVPYTFFQVLVNNPQSKFWFVNTLNPFIFNNDSLLYTANNMLGETFLPCSTQRVFPSFTYYGLPAYLGFKNVASASSVCTNKYDLTLFNNGPSTTATSSDTSVPSTIIQPTFAQNYIEYNGESGPNYVSVHYVKPSNTFTLVKNTSIFIDIATMNGVDATRPFTNNDFTKITNQGNGSVNSFLGRITLLPTTINFSTSTNGGDIQPIVNFNPPLERVTRLKISIRYHDGSLVNFGFHEWMIALLLESYLPSQNVKLTQTPF